MSSLYTIKHTCKRLTEDRIFTATIYLRNKQIEICRQSNVLLTLGATLC